MGRRVIIRLAIMMIKHSVGIVVSSLALGGIRGSEWDNENDREIVRDCVSCVFTVHTIFRSTRDDMRRCNKERSMEKGKHQTLIVMMSLARMIMKLEREDFTLGCIAVPFLWSYRVCFVGNLSHCRTVVHVQKGQ